MPRYDDAYSKAAPMTSEPSLWEKLKSMVSPKPTEADWNKEFEGMVYPQAESELMAELNPQPTPGAKASAAGVKPTPKVAKVLRSSQPATVSPSPSPSPAPAPAPQNPADFPENIVPGGVKPNSPGAMAQNDFKDVIDQRTSVQRALMFDPQQTLEAQKIAMGYEPEEYGRLVDSKTGEGIARTVSKWKDQPNPEHPYQQQAAGLMQLNELVDAMKGAPHQIDLSPLMALVDSQTGSRLLAGYKKPEDLREKILKYTDEIQKRRQDMAKTLLEGQKAQRGGTFNDQLRDLLAFGQLGRLQDPNLKGRGAGTTDQEIRWANEMQNKLNRDTSKLTDKMDAINEVRTMMGSNLSVMDDAFKTAWRRVFGDNHISNVDVQGVAGNKAAADRIVQAVNSAIDGKFTPENRAEYLAGIDAVAAQAAKEYRGRLDKHAAIGSTTYKFKPQRAKELIYAGRENYINYEPQAEKILKGLGYEMPDYLKKVDAKEAAKEVDQKKALNEAIQEELKRRKAGKGAK